ncbi:MAG: type II toxin-antitoxin system RelE/ParE family toxin [Acidobacteria bacterium]|nr:type II toxin-antitoxin system RelE/ParE family toxin [Acidobacteriota bacterium]
MKIRWSQQSLDDLSAIHDYIARDSERYAERFVERLIGAVDRLEEFPRLGRSVPEAGEQESIREVIYRQASSRLRQCSWALASK